MSYTYSIINNFSGIIPNFTELYELVVNSSITQTLQNIIRDDDDLFTFHFSNTLTTGEIITLNNICTSTSIPYTVDFYTTYNSSVVSTDLIPQGPTDLQDLSATGPTGPTGNPGLKVSYLAELSSDGTYSWQLSRNVTYNIGTTSPTKFTSVLTPSPNDYWILELGGLKYIGIDSIYVNFTVSINYNTGGNSREYIFTLMLNGNTIPDSTTIYTAPNTRPNVISFSKVVQVSTDDILSLSVSSSTNDTMTLRNLKLTVTT